MAEIMKIVCVYFNEINYVKLKTNTLEMNTF